VKEITWLGNRSTKSRDAQLLSKIVHDDAGFQNPNTQRGHTYSPAVKTRHWRFGNIRIIKIQNYATHFDTRSGLFGLFGGVLTSTGSSSKPKSLILNRATSSSVTILILPSVAFLLEISFFRFHNIHNPIAMSTTETTPITIPTMTAVGKQLSQWFSAIGMVVLELDAPRVGVVYWVTDEVGDELVNELIMVGTLVDFGNAVVEILELVGGGASLSAAAW
jgi:hypothetical protein